MLVHWDMLRAAEAFVTVAGKTQGVAGYETGAGHILLEPYRRAWADEVGMAAVRLASRRTMSGHENERAPVAKVVLAMGRDTEGMGKYMSRPVQVGAVEKTALR